MGLTQISTAGVKDDAVTAGKIPADAVGSSEIAANAVGSSELADNAVDTAAIANGAVTTVKINASAVVTDSLATDAVTGAKIADNAIDSEHYTDGSIDTAHIGTGQVTGAKLAAGAVSEASKIADSIITGAKIGSGTIAAGNIASNAVTTAKIADDAITQGKIAGGSVDGGKLATNAVSTVKIADQAVTLAKLPHGTSSNDGKFLRANNGADPSFETVTSTTINNNADNRVITGSGTANTLNGESTFVYDTTKNTVGIGTSSPEPTASYYQGACLHLHQASSASSAGSQIHLTNGYGGSGASDGSQVSHYSNSLYINNQENGATYFYNNGNDTMTITSAGNVGINTQSPSDKLHVNGTALVGSNFYVNGNTYLGSGQGIYFDGASNAAHFLHDYEEGDWTPNVAGNNSGSYSTRIGKYVKIGMLVHVDFYIAVSGVSYGTSGFRLAGLPFTPTGYGAGSFMSKYHSTNNNRWFVLHTSNADSTLYSYGTENGQNWESLAADSSFEMIGTITYRTTA